jgi:hypothetical protein
MNTGMYMTYYLFHMISCCNGQIHMYTGKVAYPNVIATAQYTHSGFRTGRVTTKVRTMQSHSPSNMISQSKFRFQRVSVPTLNSDWLIRKFLEVLQSH